MSDNIVSNVGLYINCKKCGIRLTVQGGLLFGPPMRHGHTLKTHLCMSCYDIVYAFIEQSNSSITDVAENPTLRGYGEQD